MQSPRSPVFTTTHWSMVLCAKDRSPNAAGALERLCSTYWYPLYAFLRRQGNTHERAEDLTQGFFEQLLSGNFLETVHPSKGRFRSFLLASLKNFVANEHDKDRAEKRGGKCTILPLDAMSAATRYELEPSTNLTPEKLFDRSWALSVIEQAFQLMREKFGGNHERFEILKPFLMGDPGDASYREVAEKLHTTEGALKTDCHRLRKRWFASVREVISLTVDTPQQTEDELQELIAALRL